jgi:hypothetical protein
VTQDAAWGVTSPTEDDRVDVARVDLAGEDVAGEENNSGAENDSGAALVIGDADHAGQAWAQDATDDSTTDDSWEDPEEPQSQSFADNQIEPEAGDPDELVTDDRDDQVTGQAWAQGHDEPGAGEGQEDREMLGLQEAATTVETEPADGTGHPAVDAAVRAVVNAESLSMAEQLAAYEGAHQTLREVLASIED